MSVIALLGIVLLLCFDKYFYQNVRHTLSTLAASTLFCNATLRILPEVSSTWNTLRKFTYYWSLILMPNKQVILSKQIEATTGSYTADEFIVAEHIGKIVLVIAGTFCSSMLVCLINIKQFNSLSRSIKRCMSSCSSR